MILILRWFVGWAPGRIEYYICLCGHFEGVPEIQTSLDVSALFILRVTKNGPLVVFSSTVTCLRCLMYYKEKLGISHFGQ